VLHVHNLNHVEINVSVTLNSLNGIDNKLSEWVGKTWMNLSVEGSAGNLNEKIS